MKKLIGIVLIGLACVTFFLQYHRVNAGVAREFEIDEYQMDDTVLMEKISLQVVEIQLEESYHLDGGNPWDQYNVTPVRVSIQVQNLTNRDVELGGLYEMALHQGGRDFQTYEIENKIPILPALAVEDIVFVYRGIPSEDILPDFTLAIPQPILLNTDASRFQEKWELGKIHGITIDVSVKE